MDILFKREQAHTPLTERAVFKLWAKIELSDSENELVGKYGFRKTVLIEAIQPGLVRAALFVGLLAFLVCYLVMILGLNQKLGLYLNWFTLLFVSALCGCLFGYYYYTQKRETIYMRDLLLGRSFICRSVIELARKEAFLEQISAHLRQVLEGAKHWGGTTQIEVQALPPEEAKRALLRGPLF